MSTYVPMARLARICALLFPLFLLGGDLLQLSGEAAILWTILLWISFLCAIPAIAGLVLLAWPGAPRLALAGGILGLIGAVAGASMQVAFRNWAMLRRAGESAAADELQRNMALLLSTQVPGIFFPIGLLLLAWSLVQSRSAPRWTGTVLGAGAILFPIGHAVGMSIPLVVGDLLLLVSFWSVMGVMPAFATPSGDSSHPAIPSIRKSS